MLDKVEINEDWEEWDPSSTPFYVHMVAGSFAGAAEHLVVFPFDTIKTFLQADGSRGRAEIRELIKTHGASRLWRGVSTALMGCVPAHAGYFSIYEWGKITFGADGPNHAPMAAAATGALATVAHDAVMSPMDVVKQRLQLGFHANVLDAFKSILKTEGPIALFRSFPTTLAMNMPFAACSIATNESLRKVMNPSGEFSLSTFVISGFLSGAVAGFFTTPFDVVRTRLNVQDLHVKVEKTLVNGHTSRFASRLNSGVMPSALLSSARKLSNNFVAGLHHNHQRHPTYAVARLKYTRPVRCPLPIALWASPGSSTLTSPAEVAATAAAKVLSAAAGDNSPIRYAGPFQAARSIWEQEGYRGFFRGAPQRMTVMAPGFAISWTAYEAAKSVLMGEQ